MDIDAESKIVDLSSKIQLDSVSPKYCWIRHESIFRQVWVRYQIKFYPLSFGGSQSRWRGLKKCKTSLKRIGWTASGYLVLDTPLQQYDVNDLRDTYYNTV